MSVPNPDQLGSVSRRLASCIRMLLSPNDSERAADIHALADRIEKSNGGLSDADKQRIRAEIENARAVGYAEGVQAAEARQHGTGAFRNTDGTLEWTEVALFVQRQKHRLDIKHHEFIDDMASRTVYGREPTPRQHQYLHSLFYKLGGKVT